MKIHSLDKVGILVSSYSLTSNHTQTLGPVLASTQLSTYQLSIACASSKFLPYHDYKNNYIRQKTFKKSIVM